jgi:hypothetical protein
VSVCARAPVRPGLSVTGISCFLQDMCLQADDPMDLACILALLWNLFFVHPCFKTAALEMKVTPGLVSALHQLLLHGGSTPETLHTMRDGLNTALNCLEDLVQYDMLEGGDSCSSAVDAGVGPVLVEVLMLGHEPTVVKALEVSRMLLMAAPEEDTGEWRVGLVCATARLLSADPPVAVRDAVELLHLVGMTDLQLIADCYTSGIEDGLQRVTVHSEPGIRTAAHKLKELLFCGIKGPDVSSTLNPCIFSAGPLFWNDMAGPLVGPSQHLLLSNVYQDAVAGPLLDSFTTQVSHHTLRCVNLTAIYLFVRQDPAADILHHLVVLPHHFCKTG